MSTTQTRPDKPRLDFPLFAHASGQWAKKIKGKLHYFGPWKDSAKAEANYLARTGEQPESQDQERAPKISAGDRPAKPQADFPLFPHASKQWAKKIRGKTHYFGHWDDPKAALECYLDEKDDLFAGRTPRNRRGEATLAQLVERFLKSKTNALEAGELAQRTYDDYEKQSNRVKAFFGETRIVSAIAPEDFGDLRARMAKTLNPVSLGNAINLIRILFKFAADERIIPAPLHFGQSFNRPSAKTLRIERKKIAPRLFTPEQIRAMLDDATKPMRAMILLGINAGFGNSDCATLPIGALNLKTSWHNYARPKTGMDRRCKLWPETVAALQEVLASRPSPTSEANENLVFITRHGASWADDPSSVTKECDKVIKKLGFKRPGLAFYALRHTFQTYGERSRDMPAVSFIMGHAPASNDMASTYREEVANERLEAVTKCVHEWLYGAASSTTT